MVMCRNDLRWDSPGLDVQGRVARPCHLNHSLDLCFITSTPIKEVEKHIRTWGVKIVEGPVRRTGAKGTILSIYLYDPDDNLIELSNCIESKDEK